MSNGNTETSSKQRSSLGASFLRSVARGPLAISVLLHVSIALVLLFFTPLREVVFAQDEPNFQRSTESMSARDIADVAELIEKAQAEQQRLMVEQLLEVERILDEQHEEKLPAFEQFEQLQVEHAPDRLVEALDKAAEAMAAAREALEADKADEAMVHQIRAEEAHEVVRDRLRLTSADEQLVSRQAEVIQTQQAATAAAARTQDATARQRSAQAAVERETKQVEQRQKQAGDAAELTTTLSPAEAQQKADESEAEARQARAEAMKLDAAAKAARRELSDANKRAQNAQKAVDNARKKKADDLEAKERALAEARQPLSELQSRETEASAAVAQAWAKVNAAEAATRQYRLAKELADLARANEQAEQAGQEITESLQTSLKEQIEAIRKQEALAEALRQEVQRLADAAATTQTEPSEAKPLPAELAGKPFAELYEEARAAERRIIERYKEVKAMDLAVIRDVSLEAAKQTVDVPQPDRPELDRGRIETEARTGEQLDAKKAELARGLTETAEMVQLANLLLSGSERQMLAGGMTLEQILAMRQRQLAMDELAVQTAEGQVTDFTQQADAAAQSTAPPGGEEPTGKAPEVQAGQETLDPPPEVSVTNAVPGRAISVVGKPAGWVFVSDWWLLGPFDNTGRANIDRSFPPEALPQSPNLNAAYQGKTGRTIRWYFHSSARPAVIPPNEEPYGIWYAWTELEFDAPRDVWVALGSDDKGRMWLNGQLVWVDRTDEHKGWKPGYKLVKLPFKAGRNAVLYRIENGQHGMAFSMMLHLGEGEGISD
ncbi:MAG: hypothetical protein ACFCVE_11450 [Phycisphaerae bacterium]